MAAIDSLLKQMAELGASDLHVRASLRPQIRQGGEIVALAGAEPLTPEQARAMLNEIMPTRNRQQFEAGGDTDFAYAVKAVGRFRVNVLMGSTGVGAVFRAFPPRVPTADSLGLPPVIRELCALTKGLVLVTGPTGSGKSTTLAAMIDLINKTRTDHIITIEDPIEFVHTPQQCLVTQREVHTHTESFSSALRAALREDPDIVLVGELRDLETIEIAIETAATGHLVFGTLHTNTAASTVNRVIDMFPADRQNQIRSMLSESLKGVVAQTLCKRIPSGRVAALEVLLVTTAVASNIRDGKTHQIPSAMQTGRSLGMQTFGDALLKLVTDGLISYEEACRRAVDRDALVRQLNAAGIKPELAAPPAREAPAPPLPVPESPPAAPDPMELVVSQCMEELRRDPANATVLNNLAWVLATSANPRLRNAAEAMQAAHRAHLITQGRNAAVLDTLGAVYAEAGQFEKALTWARKGFALATETNQQSLAQALAQRIQLYESGQPHRQQDLRHELDARA